MSNSSKLNTAQLLISKEQQITLKHFVGAIVPEDTQFNVPSAADDSIFADILDSVVSQRTLIFEALAALESSSQQTFQSDFASITSTQKLQITRDLQQSLPETIWSLITLTFECYYRDDRVMSSIDMEVRSPFPSGFTVEQGDWSLLDQVKKRPKFYRQC